jgi:hypothetical protein
MDYELAKSLMDAGFPQIGKGSLIGSPNKLVWRSGDRVYVPTLEELIEACGRNFDSLDRQHDGWMPLRITIRVALRKPLLEPSPAYGSRFKTDDRQEGAKIKTWKPAGSLSPAPAFVRFWTTANIVEFFGPGRFVR